MIGLRKPLRPARTVVVLLCLPLLAFGALACEEEDSDPAVAEASPSPTESETSASPSVEASPTASPTATGEHPACEPAQRISDLDDSVTSDLNAELTKLIQKVTAGQEITDAEFARFTEQVQQLVQEKLPELIDAYKDLEAALPPDLADKAKILREFTVDFTNRLVKLTPDQIKNLQKYFEGPEVLEAAGATFALDKFTQDECGIVLAD